MARRPRPPPSRPPCAGSTPDLPPDYRPTPHPCFVAKEQIARIADPEERREAIRGTPSECLQMWPPVIEVSSREAALGRGAP